MRTYRDYLEIYTNQYFGANSESELDDYDFFEQLAPEVETRWGATQVCIIDPDLEDVIKIFFNGEFENIYDEDDDYSYDVDFIEFRHDYANIAETIYEDAKKLGFGDFFAAFEKIGETDGSKRPVFRQEYVIPLDDGGYSNPSKKAIDIVNKKQYADNDKDNDDFDEVVYMERAKWRTFDTRWTAAAIDAYGYELVERFLSFVRETSIHLDMHSGNYGYRKDGTPCILDWAGFDEP